MNFSPSTIDRSTDAAASPVADSRSIATVITSPAEKKKLAQSNQKHAFDPSHVVSTPITAGATICDSCCACDIQPIATDNPAAASLTRTTTVCTGIKKLETPAQQKQRAVNRKQIVREQQRNHHHAANQIARHGPLHIP